MTDTELVDTPFKDQDMGEKLMKAQRVHAIKVWPEYFNALVTGLKPFELRKNDRDYRVGDALRLRVWDPDSSEYTGAEVAMNVTYVLAGDEGERFGLKPGYAVLGLSCMSADEVLDIVSGRRALAEGSGR